MNERAPLSVLLPVAMASGFVAIAMGACTASPIETPLRSLHSSGPMAFMCLGSPNSAENMARPLTACSGGRSFGRDDYDIPHIYALVTQPIRGEVALVDLTTDSDAVLDSDPSVPGATFLPVGAQPVAIVTTPGSTAAFVATAEASFERIFALPASMVRSGPRRLSSWPGCSLPSAPGALAIAIDPPNEEGELRPNCDADYGELDESTCGPTATLHCHGDLSAEADSTRQPGRQKLLVTLPSEGGFAVIDAQDILDQEPGAFEPCPIERWVPLTVELPTFASEPLPEELGCVNDRSLEDPFAESFTAHPGDMDFDGDQLYIADRTAPLIHRIDLPTPCEPLELPGLLPRSVEDPSRVVTTNNIEVSPLTLDLKRYLYATDVIDGSAMVFDVSEDATRRTPLRRSTAGTNPFQPSDRIRFQSPPRDIIVVHHRAEFHDEETGSSVPVRCDPDPTSTGPGTEYRTEKGFERGAGPMKLRGLFALVVLESGDIVFVDIDDYDAACRGPSEHVSAWGCADDGQSGLVTSGEYSCNTVEPHAPRAAGYLVQEEGIARNLPGLRSFPVMFDPDGAVLDLADEENRASMPRMRATIPAEALPSFNLAVGTEVHKLDPSTGQKLTSSGAIDPTEHTLAANLEDPRAHILEQEWVLSYEGPLPGFGAKFAELAEDPEREGGFELRDVSSRFCDRGVISYNAVQEMLAVEGAETEDPAQEALMLADYVQLASSIPVETNDYWATQTACSFNQCDVVYGTRELPRAGRDLRIVEARNDLLELEPRHNLAEGTPPLKCCFPGVVEFRVRVGEQWVAKGGALGFLHRVIVDPDNGTCRNSCDPAQARLSSRLREVPQGTVLTDGDPRALLNPFFRFYIEQGVDCEEGDCVDRSTARDTKIEFTTQGSFNTMAVNVATSDIDVLPAAVEYLMPTGEIVVSDGSLEGLILLDLDTVSISRQYY